MSSTEEEFDAIVVGAGFSGLYAIYKLREAGLNVRAYELGGGVGGVWYWNRYPGARTDSSVEVYQYYFSDELLEEWDWSERFSGQSETEDYLNFVADKFDLRPHIQFNTKVTSARFNESTERWQIETADGGKANAAFLLMCGGGLTEAVYPDIPGRESFAGEHFHTARWPQETVDLSGKRVGVFGTGATGIQVIQTIADKVGSLKVFQRTPTYTVPMRNPKYTPETLSELRGKYETLKTYRHETFAGAEYDFDERPYFSLSPEERRQALEDLWSDGSLVFWIGSFFEVFVDENASKEFSEFVREKTRERINDPEVAKKLIPTEYTFGTRRVPLETNYYEAYNRENVELVDIREAPVTSITSAGVETTNGKYDLDVLIYATGFDAGTGVLTAIDIVGRNGLVLRDKWADGVRGFMGLQVHDFPNMFMTMGPLSPAAAFCNAPTCIQQQVEWITNCINFVRDQNAKSIEPSHEAEEKWMEHHEEIASQVLVSKANSWYMGSNIEGKKRTLLAYAGGAHVYNKLCSDIVENKFKEFDLV